MMCYRDKTWCPFSECNKFNKCDRALTEEVLKDAKTWWGSDGVPICQYVDKPDCFVELI